MRIPLRAAPSDETDWEEARELAWRVFLADVLPDCEPQAREVFHRFLHSASLIGRIRDGGYRLYVVRNQEAPGTRGAQQQSPVIGMMLVRDRHHIAALFVDSSLQHRGAGRALIMEACTFCRMLGETDALTVNASPGGRGFYERMGFAAVREEQLEDGMRFVPMARPAGQNNEGVFQ